MLDNASELFLATAFVAILKMNIGSKVSKSISFAF